MRKLNVIEDKCSAEDLRDLEASRPKTRGDCVNGIRPCPFVSCKHNTYLRVTQKGELTTFHEEDVDELTVSNCALDYAPGSSYEEIGAAFGTSHQAIDVIIKRAMRKLRELDIEFEESEPKQSNLAWAQDLL